MFGQKLMFKHACFAGRQLNIQIILIRFSKQEVHHKIFTSFLEMHAALHEA